jgi:chromosome condensin MukBEF MukE localization factor
MLAAHGAVEGCIGYRVEFRFGGDAVSGDQRKEQQSRL